MDKQKEASIPNVCLFPNMVTPQPVQRMEFSLPLIAPKGVSPIKQEESMKVDLTPGRGLRDQFTFSTIPSFSNFGVASPSLVQFSASSLVVSNKLSLLPTKLTLCITTAGPLNLFPCCLL